MPDPSQEPEIVASAPVPSGETEPAPSSAGPRCGYCGSAALHESSRGGFHAALLRLLGARLYRCETCGRRFAFAMLGRPDRHRAGRRGERRHAAPAVAPEVEVESRRRALGAFTMLAAA